MMTKPRIVKLKPNTQFNTLKLKLFQYKCFCNEVEGFGTTLKEAYNNWIRGHKL